MAVAAANGNAGASSSQAPSTGRLAVTTGTLAVANASGSAAPAPAPKLKDEMTDATDWSQVGPGKPKAFVGMKGTIYNRPDWMYKDPKCPPSLCDACGSTGRLREISRLKEELDLFGLCWKCLIARHPAKTSPTQNQPQSKGVHGPKGNGKTQRPAGNF